MECIGGGSMRKDCYFFKGHVCIYVQCKNKEFIPMTHYKITSNSNGKLISIRDMATKTTYKAANDCNWIQ